MFKGYKGKAIVDMSIKNINKQEGRTLALP